MTRHMRTRGETAHSSLTPIPAYPDSKPSTDFEHFVSRLNMESFPASQYSKIDDILVYSLFVSKKHFRYRRRLQPPSVFLSDTDTLPTSGGPISSAPTFTNEDASTLYRIYQASVPKEEMTSELTITRATEDICSSMPNIFNPDDSGVLKQYVTTHPALFQG